MGEIVGKMFGGLREGMLQRDRQQLESVQRMDDQVDVLEADILRYLAELRTRSLTERESDEVALAMRVADGFESVGDVIETDLIGLGYRVLDENIESSEAMRYLFQELGNRVASTIDLAVQAVGEGDERAAAEVLTIKADIDHIIQEALDIQSKGIAGVSPAEIEMLRMEMTALENLKRIHTYLKRIAREIVPEAVRSSA